MNRDTQSVLLVLLGGAVVRISVDDTYLRYVRSWTRPYLLTAGLILIILGLASLWREHIARRGSPGGARGGPAGGPGSGHVDVAAGAEAAVPAGSAGSAPEAAGIDEHGHDHSHGPRVAWLLLLPIFAIFLVAPPALGSYAAGRGANNIAKPAAGGDFAPLPDGDPVPDTLTDFATRAIWDGGRSLQGRHIKLVGFISPRPAGGYYLTRLVITCCAADARPIKLAVQGDTGQLPTDSWVEVTGSYGGIDTATKTEQIPVVRADSVTPIKPPSEPYES